MTDEPGQFERYRDQVERPLWELWERFGQERRGWFGLGLVLSLVERLMSLLPPFILGIAIDAVLTQQRAYRLPLVPRTWIPDTRAGQLWFSFGLIAGSFILASVLSTARMLSVDYYTHRLMHEVRTATYDQMQALDPIFFEDHDKGELISVLNNDVSNFEVFFDDGLTQSIRIVTIILGTVGILFYMNWQLALVTLAAVPMLGAATLWFMHRIEPVYDDIRSAVGSMNTRLENNLGGMNLIKTMTTEGYESQRVEGVSWRYFTTNWNRIKIGTVYHPGTRLITNTSFAATFLIGGYWLVFGPPLFFSGSVTVGTLVTFLFMSQRFTGPLKNISNIIDRYENARASSKRVLTLLEMPAEIEDDEDAVELESVEGYIEYDDVRFSYVEEDDPILRDVSFEAEPGESIALVGPTGAGKSTVLKLLMRMYDVDEGAVRVDGYDIRNVTLESLRNSIGYVSQEGFLFGGTVEENIRYGQFDASHEDIVEAAKAAEAHGFIEDFSDGYDTHVGESGVKLSGGQRQRLCIARTILQNPDVLILDEATSDVDTETEMLIQQGLEGFTEDRTTFEIAHRLSTIKDADTILVLEDGEIVERGTHEDLLERDSLYANLWSVQVGEIDELPDSFVERVARG